jgi:ABC-type oligopeptide transport system substrate-binding subunit
MGWTVQYNDPANMLEVFKLKDAPPNHTGWQNADFIKYTDQSLVTTREEERWASVEAAEKIFVEEMPSIPVNDLFCYYLEQPYVKGVVINPLMQLYFDKASLEN